MIHTGRCTGFESWIKKHLAYGVRDYGSAVIHLDSYILTLRSVFSSSLSGAEGVRKKDSVWIAKVLPGGTWLIYLLPLSARTSSFNLIWILTHTQTSNNLTFICTYYSFLEHLIYHYSLSTIESRAPTTDSLIHLRCLRKMSWGVITLNVGGMSLRMGKL